MKSLNILFYYLLFEFTKKRPEGRFGQSSELKRMLVESELEGGLN